jgi:oligopeptide/dipeptide ABC transporter ATP-binding protein
VEVVVHIESEVILEVSDLATRFSTLDGTVRAVNGVDFRLHKSEAMAIVGESACGKSVAALSIMRLIQSPGKIVSGRAVLAGEDLLNMPVRELRNRRGERISMIFQNAVAALDPSFTIGDQMTETYVFHRKVGQREAMDRCLDLLARVKVASPERVMREYPFEISIGTAQRVMIATALLCNPYVLIADEPTTNLDSISQMEMLALIDEIRREEGLSIIIITHDFGVVAQIADKVGVMYAGKLVEEGDVDSIIQSPRHPYTFALLASVPRRGCGKGHLYQIGGQPPDPTNLPPGCSFAPRCPFVMDVCKVGDPPIRHFSEGRWMRCFLNEGASGE